MRVFLAIEIPQDIKGKLAEIQEKLRSEIPGVRWEKPEKLHLTLVFLGPVKEERISELEGVVRKGLKGAKGINVGLAEVGFFPKGSRPRVVLVEVGEGREKLVGLQKRLAAALSEAGFSFARLSRPHVTLGRFSRHTRSSSASDVPVDGRGLPQILKSWQRTDVVGFAVKEVVIMESRLRPTGSVYTPLSRIPLTKNKNHEN